MSHDPRVPAYLGRVLGPGGEYAGTCFQLTRGCVATAWHVLEALGAGEPGNTVAIDSLSEPGRPWDAVVHAVDELSDLAVLRSSRDLGAAAPGPAATDEVPIGTEVVVTGAADVEDPGHRYLYLDAPGEWAGGTTRDDSVPLGRIRCQDVLPGMSGAPVRRLSDDVVVGVVSGRYNSADGWLAGSVWIARTEQLAVLCEDLEPIETKTAAARAPIELCLGIDEGAVRLSGEGVDLNANHSGVPAALSRTVNEAWRARVRRDSRGDDDSVGHLDRAGELLAESFLPASLAIGLAKELDRAERGHQVLRLGIECDADFSNLPWEALPDPRDGTPLALHPLTSVYRKVEGAAPQLRPSPLRILVAISSPDRDGGPPLDYEGELRNVLAAVRAARQGNAHVRIVPFATTGAIKRALEVDPAHVLHLSGHGSPGRFILEDAQGDARQIDADTFVEEAIPAGAMPPVVALSACYTNVAEATGAPSFAAKLVSRGASTVIASETSLTDVYATRVFARIYGRLADAAVPDAIGAACDARRIVQAELVNATDDRDRQLGELNEWAALSIIGTAGSIPVLDQGTTVQPPPPPPRPAIGPVAARAVGDFVGRRNEQRKWPLELLAHKHAGMVLHGVGGGGKTSLAAELVTRTFELEPNRTKLVLYGQITADGLLSAAAAAARQRALTDDRMQDQIARALMAAADGGLQWPDRLMLLREHVLDSFPLLIVLDNFEDNLQEDGAGFGVNDPALAALLADWVSDPAASRFLVTSRHPFSLPESRDTRLLFKSVGPLSAAETGKLVWSLPALDRLTRDEVEKVWRLLGGHPRSLEYLDALLSQGVGRYPDITERLNEALAGKLGEEGAGAMLRAERTLDEALASIASIAADDVLLSELIARLDETKGARELLLGVSTFRRPVGIDGVLFQAGKPNRPGVSDAEIAVGRARATAEAMEILEGAGVESPAALDLERLSPEALEEFRKRTKKLEELPEIPRDAPAALDAMIAAGVASSLLSQVEAPDGERVYFVHRWTASELEGIERERGQGARVEAAHAKAGDYWNWRAYCAHDTRSHADGLIEARHHYLEAGLVDRAIEVSAEASRRLDKIGALDERLRLVRDTLDLVSSESADAAIWMLELASTLFAQGDRTEAERLYRKALPLMESHGKSDGIAACAFPLGIIALGEGELDEAERLFQRALEVAEEERDQTQIASVTEQLGQVAWRRGEIIEARELRERAAQIRDELGDSSSRTSSYISQAQEAMKRDDLDEAEAALLQALEFMEASEDAIGIAGIVSALGDIALRRGELDEAERHYVRALEIHKDIGSQQGVGFGHAGMGHLFLQRNEPAEAEASFKRSLAIMEAIDDPPGVAGALSGLAHASFAQENVEKAVSLHARAFLTLRDHRYIQDAIGEIQQLEALQEIVGDEVLRDALLSTLEAKQAKEVAEFLNIELPDSP